MSCYYHEGQEAVAQCQKCGKTLCRECASLYQTPYCAECAKAEADAIKSDVIKLGAIGIIIGVAAVIYMFTSGLDFLWTILLGVIFACTPFGWRTMTMITPRMFLFLPVIGWLIYFYIKLIISAFIGWVAAPIKIYKMMKIVNMVAVAEENRRRIGFKMEE